MGRFSLSGIEAGEAVVRIRRIGYGAQYFGATFRPGESRDVEIVLIPGALELPEIKVTARSAKPIEYAWTTRYDDFFRRRLVGLGVYRSRDYIERAHPFRTANLLTGIAGIHLRFRHSGPSGTDVIFNRCERVSVWIDGSKQRFPEIPEDRRRRFPKEGTGMALSELLERVSPSQIEMIEVYRGPSEMPAEFIDDSCGAVAMWTR